MIARSNINSTIKNIISQRGIRMEFVVLDNGIGEKTYAYLLIREDEFERFQRDGSSGKKINLDDYGHVFFQGEGETPPDGVDDLIRDFFKKEGDWSSEQDK